MHMLAKVGPERMVQLFFCKMIAYRRIGPELSKYGFIGYCNYDDENRFLAKDLGLSLCNGGREFRPENPDPVCKRKRVAVGKRMLNPDL